ncbi:ComEC/Rec2 family competence protein [Natrinema altunense]|uniref:MBL fold metallo-hydrolase n=1 Tax=Natrinema altunense TaxID=222984 RepID=A0A482Y0E6_9EURY|nr:MBL fold metallo-hydrolase [Natrinema altunense]RZH69461.1 MBL fold metallo-hydrolase [Natrinema altunense]
MSNGSRVFTLDVGQADARLIVTEDDSRILIDADKEQIISELDKVFKKIDSDRGKVIDYLITTHLDEDHVLGVQYLDEAGYDVQNVGQPKESRFAQAELEKVHKGKERVGGKVDPRIYSTFEESLRNDQKIPPNQRIEFSIGHRLNFRGSEAKFLSPPRSDDSVLFESPKTGRNRTFKPENANENGLAIKFEDENRTSHLFMGDIQDTGGHNAEDWLVKQHEDGKLDLNSDVLHVGHHGSHNATKDGDTNGGSFVDAVDPDTAVISSGLTNSHDHPRDEVLERLDENGAAIYWTGVHGTVEQSGGTEDHSNSVEAISPADILALKHYVKENDVTKEELAFLEEGSISAEDLPRDTPELAFKSKYLDTAEKAHRTIRRYPKDAETLTLNRFPKAMSTEYVSVDQHEADVPALDGDAEELSPKAHRLTEDLDATIEACMDDIRGQRQNALQRLANDSPRSRSTHSRQQSKSSEQSSTQTSTNTRTNKDSDQSKRNNRTRKR